MLYHKTVVTNHMANANTSESPLESIESAVGEQTIEAFKILGNDTRLAILLALWDAQDHDPAQTKPTRATVSYSELKERIGVRDSGHFNYHLGKLTGTFVESSDEGYELKTPGEQILHAVLAGTLMDHSSFRDEPLDVACYRCGASTVVDYREGMLIERCTSCEGKWHSPDAPPGMISGGYLPPVGLENRSPQEFHRTGNTWIRYRLFSMMEGVCPDCSGTVTASINGCEDHDTADETVCVACGSLFEIQWLFVCDVCKLGWRTPGAAPIYTELGVSVFFHEHGLDPNALYDASALAILHDAVDRVAIRSEDPVEVVVTVELDGDRLDVTLDGDARVLEATPD